MPELSPAAQAVLDAFRSSHTGPGCLAAALRAAADQVAPASPSADHAHLAIRYGLHRIADELEAQ